FQKDNRRLPAPPQDGMQVFLFARPTVWEEKGEFRLTVVDLLSTEAGGLWQLAFEKAKAALAKDGLPGPARKRPLPRHPRSIAHETGVPLCGLVADVRAPTPSAAAEAATPDRADVLVELAHLGARLARGLAGRSGRVAERLDRTLDRLTGTLERRLERHRHELSGLAGRLDALSPLKILERGYALARDEQGRVLKRVVQFSSGLRFR